MRRSLRHSNESGLLTWSCSAIGCIGRSLPEQTWRSFSHPQISFCVRPRIQKFDLFVFASRVRVESGGGDIADVASTEHKEVHVARKIALTGPFRRRHLTMTNSGSRWPEYPEAHDLAEYCLTKAMDTQSTSGRGSSKIKSGCQSRQTSSDRCVKKMEETLFADTAHVSEAHAYVQIEQRGRHLFGCPGQPSFDVHANTVGTFGRGVGTLPLARSSLSIWSMCPSASQDLRHTHGT